jgi:hypothetical protein
MKPAGSVFVGIGVQALPAVGTQHLCPCNSRGEGVGR